MLKKIVFQPGINKEGTNYSAEGGWYNSDKIRFRKGRPEKIGGWTQQSADTFLGVCRKLHNWMTLDSENYLGIGTDSKVYVEYGTTFYDITPSYDYSKGTSPGPSFLTADLGGLVTNVTINITDGDIAAKGWKAGDVARISSPFVSGEGGPAPFEYVHIASVDGSGDPDVLTATASTGRAYFKSTIQSHFQNADVSPTAERIPKAIVTDAPTTSTTGGPVAVHNGSSNVLIRQDDHACGEGDYVTFLQLGAAVPVGVSLANSDFTVPTGFRVVRSLDADNYEIDIGSTAATTKTGTLVGTLSSSGTSLVITTSDNDWDLLATPFWVKIEDEYLKINSVSGTTSPFTLTLSGSGDRAQFGSTAEEHTSASVNEVKFICDGDTYLLHDINSGPAIFTEVTGWGRGSWGEGAWDESILPGDSSTSGVRIWSVDNYGEDLVLCPRDGVPYYWDASEKKGSGGIINTSPASSADTKITVGVPNAQAVPLSSIGGPSDPGYSYSNESEGIAASSHVPTKVRQMMVFPQSKMLIAFGCADRGGNFNPMLVRWSSDKYPGSWDPLDIDNPGTTSFMPLTVGSEIIAAARAKMEILIWTDAAVYRMAWSGGTTYFSFGVLSHNISIAGPLAYTVAGDKIYWMGDRNFYVYDGTITIIPCTVLDYVFSDFNYSQRQLSFAAPNPAFSEVIFFYCTADSETIDRYVTYNYEEAVWAIGSMDRTSWSDSGLRENPLATRIISSDDNTSKLYEHEIGTNDVDIATGISMGMESFIESSYFDIEDGDRFSFISRIIPDVQFTSGGTSASNDMTIEIKKKDFPNQDVEEVSASSSSVTRSTTQDYVRVRGRQASVKFSTDEEDVDWRLGDSRIDIRPDGRR